MIKLEDLPQYVEKWLPKEYYNKRYGYIEILYKSGYIAIVKAINVKSNFVTDGKPDSMWLINYYGLNFPKLYFVTKMNFQKYISQVMFTGEVGLRGEITKHEKDLFKDHGIFVLDNEV